MSMRVFLSFAALLALSLVSGPQKVSAEPAAVPSKEQAGAQPPAAATRPVVVELFTSQGCSDCPPADKLLTELAKRKDVIALSLPITYWDMLGWKDTFASEANTLRQKAYAKFMGKSGVYTPQIIIDGTSDVIGGRRDDVLAAVAKREANKPAVGITIKTSPQEVEIAIAGDKDADKSSATIWVMHTLSHAAVNVTEGENKNQNLAYTNVVRDLKAIGLWKGEAMTLDLPRGALTAVPHDGFVVVLQRDRYGQIIGAAMVTAPNYTGKH